MSKALQGLERTSSRGFGTMIPGSEATNGCQILTPVG